MFAIRIQALTDYNQKILEIFTTDRFSRTVRVHHTGRKGNNPHFHIVVDCDYKMPALRMELKKHFTLAKGNTHLSVKRWDGDIKAVAYLFHEGTDVDMVRGFTPEELSQARLINEATQERIKKNAPAKIVEDATEYFKNIHNFAPSRKDVFDFIYDRLRCNGDWLPNKFQFERWEFRIQANVRTDQSWRTLKENLFESWYGNFTYF